MLMIGIPCSDDLNKGAAVKINGAPTTITRQGDYLVYVDEDGKENRCKIIDEQIMEEMELPDGGFCKGIYYTCAGHEQDKLGARVYRMKNGVLTVEDK